MRRIPIALQLWSVREEANRDLPGTLDAVATIGYRAVELAGLDEQDPRSVRAALDAAGLAVAGMHVSPIVLRSNVNKVIEDALLFRTGNIICRTWPGKDYVSSAACALIGTRLGEMGAALREAGLRLSFHNHAAELAYHDGRTVLDWMLGAAAPRDLAMEPDIYWMHAAGYMPDRFLREYGARCFLVHLRDRQELGRGPVDFAAVFSALDSIGATEWLVVEQDDYNHPPLESVRLCLEQLKAWGRA